MKLILLKIKRHLLSLVIFLFSITAQSQPFVDFDSLDTQWEKLIKNGAHFQLRESVSTHFSKIKKSNNSTQLFKAYYYLAYSYQIGQFDKGLSYCDSALSLSNSNVYLVSKCRVLKGVFLRRKGEYKKSIVYFNQLMNMELNDSIRFSIHRNLSINFRKKNEYDSAIYHAQQAEKIAINIGSLQLEYYAVQTRANIHSALNESAAALQKEKRLAAIASNIGNKHFILSNTINLMASYFDLNQKDSALVYYHRAVNLAEQMNDTENLSLIYTIYSGVLVDAKDYENVESIINKAMKLSIESGRKDYTLRAYYNLCDVHLNATDYEKAINYANMGIKLAKEIGANHDLGAFYEMASYIFQQKGDYKSAFEYNEKFRITMDSILNIDKIEVIKNLEIQYETEKKEQEIAHLKQKNEIQKLRLWIITILIIVSILFIAVFIIIYYQKKLIHQKEKTATHKQQLLRSQINPHFIFNALSSIRGFLFTANDVKPAILYLGKFAKLMRMVLELSSKEWVLLSEEIKALELYLEIQNIRFDNKFEFEINVDKNLDVNQIIVPPLTAQPFIENAIEHGLKPVKKGGKVVISCKNKSGKLIFEIQDNGVGIDHIKKRKNHQSVAIQLFRERLELISHRKQHQLSFDIIDLGNDSNSTKGTLVTYELPLINKNQYV